jgi:hypothetical protein
MPSLDKLQNIRYKIQTLDHKMVDGQSFARVRLNFLSEKLGINSLQNTCESLAATLILAKFEKPKIELMNL